jgi:DNA primase
MNTSPNVDLITLIEMDLGQGHRSGRWTLFHCPFPGHKNGDRKSSLAVTNGTAERGAWWKCFACDRHGGAIRWLMEYRSMSYRDAVSALGMPLADPGRRQAFEPPIQQPDTPPGETWQARARILIKRAEDTLWSAQGKEARAWLQARGLNDDTIRRARLGYIPKDFTDRAEAWGKPGDDDRPFYFSQGILIPGIVASNVWYLKTRPSSPRADQKYKHVRGGRQALYLADTLKAEQPAVFCEGEFDALLLAQEIQDLASVVTLASATGDLNLATWGLYLLRPSCFILAHDMDPAGDKGASKLDWLHGSQRLQIPQLQPGDKDLTDFHRSGGHLDSLIENVLDPETLIHVTWSADTKPATIHDQYWRNPDQSIEAYYTPEQLDNCLGIMQAEPLEQILI